MPVSSFPTFVVATPAGAVAAATLRDALGQARQTWTAALHADPGPALDDALAGHRHVVAGGSWVERSVPLLAATYPEARFVLIVGARSEAMPADLAALRPGRLVVVDQPTLLADPRTVMQELCAFTDVEYDQALLTPVESARRQLDGSAAGDAAFGSVSTESFGAALRAAGVALLISTYQSGKLVCARERAGALNTHFRDVDKPMGIAVAPGRFALGARTEVWDFRDMPDAAPKIEPRGAHDACYLPRNRHVTGDIAIHDMAFAGGELWVVATAFSCLATLDAEHSFVPRWTPPFITSLSPGDRCHLNGLAVAGDRVTHVTALGVSDDPGGWREGKAGGGVLIDVASSEIAVDGLSMPHSPRWHDDRLWLLESGRGTLSAVDLAAGSVETVAELPGFTRGLAFAGNIAFVGLSQIRESSVFGDLPLTRRLRERMSGVWMVDVRTGEQVGFLRFDDLVQEIFDVALLAGCRYPEIADPAGPVVAQSYVLP
ncbi:MAG: TIGR03032 family protein [Solirubrobacteraceae bacterium]